MTSHSSRGEWGFTLIELLVVMVIIAILAAIAIPLFFEQKEKGFEAQMQSALKNAAIAIETYGIDSGGDFGGLDGQDISALAAYGVQKPSWASPGPAYFTIEGKIGAYCLQARHISLTASSDWRRSIFSSDNPVPVPEPNNCPNLSDA